MAVWPVSNGRGRGLEGRARRAQEGPPQESRELPTKEGEALEAPLPVPGPDERGQRVGAGDEAPRAAVWIRLGE